MNAEFGRADITVIDETPLFDGVFQTASARKSG